MDSIADREPVDASKFLGEKLYGINDHHLVLST